MGEVVIDFKRWAREKLWACSGLDLLNLNEEKLLSEFLEDLRFEFIKKNTIRETIGLIRREQEV